MIYGKIIDLVGDTPIVYYKMVNSNRIFLKLEKFNPGGSIKDRIALEMIEALNQEGRLEDVTLVEATSGNTGIGLALLCAYYGVNLIIYMPEGSSKERSDIMKAYGATIIHTPKELGMQGSIDAATKQCLDSRYQFVQQFSNINNPKAHYYHTALEILRDFKEAPDYIVCGVGTSGTLKGLYDNLHEDQPHTKFVAVEPKESNVLSSGKAGPHRIGGIGAGFVPEFFPKGKENVIIKAISDKDALKETKLLAKEGYLLGISSATAILAAKEICKTCSNQVILVICPDGGERYMTTGVFDDE